MEALNISLFFIINRLASQSPFFDDVIIFFASNLAYILVFVFVLWVLIMKAGVKEKIKIALVASASAIIGRGIFVSVIRYFYNHPRPFVTFPEAHRLISETGFSFPSGHATFFFGLSAVVYCYNKKLGATFFVFSAIMGVARIMAGVHYPLDIIGGVIIGTLVGFGSYRLVEKLFLTIQK